MKASDFENNFGDFDVLVQLKGPNYIAVTADENDSPVPVGMVKARNADGEIVEAPCPPSPILIGRLSAASDGVLELTYDQNLQGGGVVRVCVSIPVEDAARVSRVSVSKIARP